MKKTNVIGEFCNVFRFYAYSVNKMLFLTTQNLPDLATTNVYAKWIPAIEIILKEAGEWNGSSLHVGI